MSAFWTVTLLALTLPWLWGGMFGAPWKGDASTGNRQSCTVEKIYDGDTITAVCNGQRERVRLYCIDAPEMDQAPWGQRSRDHLRRITPAQVEIRPIERDRYGRLVGEVIALGRSLNLGMVEAGQAAVYDRYCDERRYSHAEQAARQAGEGVWAVPGLQQQPWEWR
jgi:endonuclease YncB( thermonuclease family)